MSGSYSSDEIAIRFPVLSHSLLAMLGHAIPLQTLCLVESNVTPGDLFDHLPAFKNYHADNLAGLCQEIGLLPADTHDRL